ncbi:hypothetical protein GGX14DRAFT_594242 [Mycena pura]|uniref:Uncharacterized protein n=1 Tax=Mycena pura TaxID=153505 RepID=A0AAD6XYG2_9AGAR|nr:hypothetical protein GGX14DRAFT_594242 [Mycena pura]
MTRCSETPTHGTPIERCRAHHEQYCAMTKGYKEAQKFVDDTFNDALIPTQEDIASYTSVSTISTILEKAQMMKKYVNAIREEMAGRDVHHRRFFLIADDGHKMRIKLLARRMTEGVEIRDALEARAMEIHMQEHPAKDWIQEFQTMSLDHDDDGPQSGEDMLAYLRSTQQKLREEQGAVSEDDDLIALKKRFAREKRLQFFEHILEPEVFWDRYFRKGVNSPLPGSAEERNLRNTYTNVFLQYTRRIVFHDSDLFAKSIHKVSVKDLVIDDDFDDDDILRVATMYSKRLKIGLKWWKDSWTEAMAIKDNSEASAKMGNPENRIGILGGWIYNNFRRTPAPNKVWYHMFMTDPPEKDNENRYVRLCCNFDELHTVLVFSALIQSNNTPSFCSRTPRPGGNPPDSRATRDHLSLCGVILADLVGGPERARVGPTRSSLPAKTRGCVTWVEKESRAYLFGAIRNELDDFTTAFLRELRARPDLFAVVVRSDTDPPRRLESFGAVTDQMRRRTFEAPFRRAAGPPAGRGEWEVLRSAENVLYGGGHDLGPGDRSAPGGYLSPSFNRTKGRRRATTFFHHKRFPVKYFLILGASPTQHVHDLARQVAWTAFKAHGLVHGTYDEAKYLTASDVLFAKLARERLSFLPEDSVKYGAGKR